MNEYVNDIFPKRIEEKTRLIDLAFPGLSRPGQKMDFPFSRFASAAAPMLAWVRNY